MFAESRYFFVAVVLCAALAGCAGQNDFDASAAPVAALTEARVTEPAESPALSSDSRCDDDGQCKVELGEVPRAVALCDGASPVLYWRNDKPSRLLACECNCTSHDNMGWFIFAEQREVQGVGLGKAATIESIRGVDRIPDIMASHPLCSNIENDDFLESDFISLIKYPTGSDASPYCFEVRSIREASGDVLVTDNNRAIDRSDDEVFFETDGESKSEILDIAKAALIPQ